MDRPAPNEAPAISIEAVVRRFGAVVAVNRLRLDVNRGEIFALVGPDGAGKTTLMRLICGALAIDAGSLRVDGVDVRAEPGRVQAAIGYMPQRFSLYPDLSVMENLRFYGDIFGVAPDDFAARSQQLLEEFALWQFRVRLAGELSGGMKQKLALSCALIHSPATILLDEPTAGVDPTSRREFWRILYRINRRGTTIFVSTPYMDEAERATRVGLMMQGALVNCGTPAELRATLQGEIIEVACRDHARARSALRADPTIRSIEIFGETLHALVDSADAAIPEMRKRLSDAGLGDVTLHRIPPTLEDAFVARLTA
jgi:ABC-2 type transport system ATP-binding protein